MFIDVHITMFKMQLVIPMIVSVLVTIAHPKPPTKLPSGIFRKKHINSKNKKKIKKSCFAYKNVFTTKTQIVKEQLAALLEKDNTFHFHTGTVSDAGPTKKAQQLFPCVRLRFPEQSSERPHCDVIMRLN